ncbi:amino acid/amide ABC transporter substrate-binding protein, HAAT family [Rhizobium sp. RU20A]|uniref:ABC transporter substrate-binding protein n=1 Tax=Rhizobium sp. RU20A TaxID=1907412 RepID=UPI00095565E8|nr:ABC transporter substrate-binding protein [Rhizobium sp. RU20A]SIR23436.1 amino acid/amide ABC transporter substrate-binding protein, HAAT family [Rhizobium sp. RU20A]
MKSLLLALLVASSALSSVLPASAADVSQYVPLPTYRVGPYASSGELWWAGTRDYFRYINEVEGGIDGIKIDYEEFETEWSPDRTVEVYERVKAGKNGSPLAFFFTHGTPATYALLEKAAADKIPLIDPAGGKTESVDGTVFPYAFPLLFSYYSQASTGINYIASKVGGLDKLKGLKIATVYHDSAYGRATQPAVDLLAKTYGFENIQIPVADPNNEQSPQWRQIREAKPDWVFLRTWGVSTVVAIKTAQRFGFPSDKIIGDVWAGSESDVIPAGAAAIGYSALAPYPAGTDFEIHKRLKAEILDKGKSDLRDQKYFGAVNYNVGLVNAALAVEALRTGYAKFGKRPLNGEEGRWAFEHLTVDDARLEKIGFKGLLQPLNITATDHEGGGAARIQSWDGQKWVLQTDWIKADHALLRPLIEQGAQAYAKEHGITPRTPETETN